MHAVLNVVMPVFGIILAGYLSGRLRLLGEQSSEALNRFVYYIALPALLFISLARVSPAEALNGPFLAAYGFAVLGTFLLQALLARVLFRRGLAETSLHGMAAVFGNTGYMGIPLVLTAFGTAAVLPAIVATVFNVAVVVAVIAALVEIDLHRDRGAFRALRGVAAALVRNPMLTSSLAGLAWAASGLDLPIPLETFFDILGAAAGPCALFAIGLFLVGKPLRADLWEVLLLMVAKLAVMPLLAWWLAVPVFGVDPLWATVAVVMAALPIGANVFVLALRYDIYVRQASAATLLSTVLSAVTLSLLLPLLQS